MYYSQKLENNKNYVNGLWDTVNDLTGKNKKDSSNLFHDDGQQLTNPNDISDAFNTYFTNIGPKLASKNNSNKKELHYILFFLHTSINLLFCPPRKNMKYSRS